MQDVLAVNRHNTKSYLGHYHHYLVVGEFLCLYVSSLDQVIETTAFCEFHDNEDSIVFQEIFIGLDKSGADQHL